MDDDSELLRRYVEEGSEEAFGELVRRRLALVYGAAFRQFGDTHRAQDVVQTVFTDLARKATSLRHRPVLVSWLYTSTHYAATNLIRAENRQRARDLEAHLMRDANSDGTGDADWDMLRPVLDQEMHHLDDREREAILLRFFEEMPFARIGEVLRLSEDAARKRVDRALERLRGRLVRRGITSTTTALVAMLAGEAGLAAPAGFVESVTGTALASAAAGGASPLGILPIMSTKSTLVVAGAFGIAGILGMGGIGTAVYEFRAAQHAQASLTIAQEDYQAEQAHLRALERSAQVANDHITELRRNLDRTLATVSRDTLASANVVPSAPKRDGAADGKNFLATFGQARGMEIALTKAQLAREYAPFYRSAGLTPSQIGQFEDQTATVMANSLVVTPDGGGPSVVQLPDDQLRQILGDQGFQQYQDYERILPAEHFVSQTTVAVGYTAEPFSADQAEQLVQIVANNSSSYQSGGNADSSSVDWNAVAEQAQSLFSPSQWQAAEGLFLRQQLAQAVAQAQTSPPSVNNP